jgi:hypothetical protein
MIKLFRANQFNKICILAVAFSFVAIGLYAQSDSEFKPLSIPERTAPKASLQEYRMVADVLDGFGGGSESDNHRIWISSGGQASAIGISGSSHYAVEAGFVGASLVIRGDANADEAIDITDVTYLINYLFIAGPEPCPQEAGDSNCDGTIDSADLVYLINYLFLGGQPPRCL